MTIQLYKVAGATLLAGAMAFGCSTDTPAEEESAERQFIALKIVHPAQPDLLVTYKQSRGWGFGLDLEDGRLADVNADGTLGIFRQRQLLDVGDLGDFLGGDDEGGGGGATFSGTVVETSSFEGELTEGGGFDGSAGGSSGFQGGTDIASGFSGSVGSLNGAGGGGSLSCDVGALCDFVAASCGGEAGCDAVANECRAELNAAIIPAMYEDFFCAVIDYINCVTQNVDLDSLYSGADINEADIAGLQQCAAEVEDLFEEFSMGFGEEPGVSGGF